METKTNIAELLKDSPKGMELDCTMYEDCTFEGIEDVGYINILIKTPNGQMKLSKYGCFIHNCEKAKCVIFPKGKTTWEGFQRPFKDGDILATDLGSVFFLNTRLNSDEHYGCYVGIGGDGSFHICAPFAYKECCRLATEEEKEKLFKAIKDNGYRWNAETKTLEKLIVPKFKVGDVIQSIDSYKVKITEVNIEDECYVYESMIAKGIGGIDFKEQDNWKLVPDKFDITTLIPFESRVLGRDFTNNPWYPTFWGGYKKDLFYPYITTASSYLQCIPYEGNEHLLGTKDDCDDYYKTWE